MTWKRLLNQNRVQQHSTNRQEIDQLREVVSRGLSDAAVTAISTDLRFQAAYNAILQLATMAIYCAAYRVKGREHHKTTFEALPFAMGESIARRTAYFDTCRRKRNAATYDLAGLISEAEIADLIKEAKAFQQDVETWINSELPTRSTVTVITFSDLEPYSSEISERLKHRLLSIRPKWIVGDA